MDNAKLNIVLFSGSNPYENSGILSYDIFKCLTQAGHHVVFITKYFDQRFEPKIESIYDKRGSLLRKFINRVKYKLRIALPKCDPQYYMYGLNDKGNYISKKRVLRHMPDRTDVIIYLFPHGFLSSKNLFELNKFCQAPIFTIPVDMAQLTGGCHYANKCNRFEQSCGECPGLYSTRGGDLSNKNILFKQKYVSKTDSVVLSNTWVNDCARRSSLYSQKPVFNLNVVIDENLYTAGDMKQAKSLFSIPNHYHIIFFGAAMVLEKRKGFTYLIDALNLLYEDMSEQERGQIAVAVAGNLDIDILESIPYKVFQLGHLTHNRLPHAYQMSDVYVSPSIQDAGPMMVIQSLMCGTPVVAFEIGNAIDYIIDGETGYKAPVGDSALLAKGVSAILKQDEMKKQKMSHRCREYALAKSSYMAFVNDFMFAYKCIKK